MKSLSRNFYIYNSEDNNNNKKKIVNDKPIHTQQSFFHIPIDNRKTFVFLEFPHVKHFSGAVILFTK